jgi:hypothetical protein
MTLSVPPLPLKCGEPTNLKVRRRDRDRCEPPISPYVLKSTYDARPCWIEASGVLSGVKRRRDQLFVLVGASNTPTRRLNPLTPSPTFANSSNANRERSFTRAGVTRCKRACAINQSINIPTFFS